MARDITFRFRTTGLEDVRSEVGKTIDFVMKSKQKLQQQNAPANVQFKVGSEVSRAESILAAYEKRYSALATQLKNVREQQRLLNQAQGEARKSGEPVPKQLRGGGGKFGATERSLARKEAQILRDLDAETLGLQEKMAGVAQRVLTAQEGQVNQAQVLKELYQEMSSGVAASASGGGMSALSERMNSVVNLWEQVNAFQSAKQLGLHQQEFATNFSDIIQVKIQQYEDGVARASEAVARVRAQIARDFPEAVAKGLLTDFEKIQAQIRKTRELIAKNEGVIAEARENSPAARRAVTRDLFGLTTDQEREVAGDSAAVSKDEAATLKRVTAALESRRRLQDVLLEQQHNLLTSAQQLASTQEGMNVGLVDPESGSHLLNLLETQQDFIGKIGQLETRGFLKTFEKDVPGIVQTFDQLNQKLEIFRHGVRKAFGSDLVNDIQHSRNALEQMLATMKAQVDDGDEAGARTTQKSIKEAQELLLSQEEGLEKTLLNNPKLKEQANEALKIMEQMRTRMTNSLDKNPVNLIPSKDQLFAQLGSVDRLMLDTFSGLKRRFITTFQFILSGTIIFGLQRVLKEFLKAAIEVERTFADIGTVLTSSGLERGSAAFITRLEHIRLSVLDLANEFNTLPAVANEAAYQMVARFANVDAALKATRAQLLAVKVSTIDQSEILRSLTAVGDTFAQSLEKNLSVYDRSVQHAELYMKALDGATVLQQKFGVQIEDTIEGTAELGEVFRQLGFDLFQTEAAIAAVSKRTGTLGTDTADRLARSIGSILTPEVRTKLLNLADKSGVNLTLTDFLGDEAGKDVIQKLSAQFDTLDSAAQNKIREIIGGRREAAFVAAFFGTAAERALAVSDMKNSVGAAEERFDALSKTTSELIAGVVAQFSSLAQNLDSLGFLSPLKLMLKLTENILNIINRLVQAVGSLVTAMDAIRLPVIGPLGQFLVTITSIALTAQALGNSFQRIALYTATLASSEKLNSMFALFNGSKAAAAAAGGLQAAPTSSAAGFAHLLVGSQRQDRLSVAGRGIPGTGYGPIAVASRGAKSLGTGIKNLAHSLRLTKGSMDGVTKATSAVQLSMFGEAAAAEKATIATTGLTASFSAFALAALKIVAVIAAVLVAAEFLKSLSSASSPNLYGTTSVQQELDRLKAEREIDIDDDGLTDVIRQLEFTSSERQKLAQGKLAELQEAFNTDAGLFSNLISSGADFLKRRTGAFTRVGGFFHIPGTPEFDPTNIGGSAEANTRESAQIIQEELLGHLEGRRDQLQNLIDSGLSEGDTLRAEQALKIVTDELANTLDPNSDEFLANLQDLTDDAVGQIYTGFGGWFSRTIKENTMRHDLGGDPGARAIILGASRDAAAGVAEGLDGLFEGLQLDDLAQTLLDPAGYKKNLDRIRKAFSRGSANAEETKQELLKEIDRIRQTRDEAVKRGNQGELVDELNDTLDQAISDYMAALDAQTDGFRRTGNVLIDLQRQLTLQIAALQEIIGFLGTDMYPGLEAELRAGDAIQATRSQLATAQFNTRFSRLQAIGSSLAGEPVEVLRNLKDQRDELMDEWENIFGHRRVDAFRDFSLSPFAGRIADVQSKWLTNANAQESIQIAADVAVLEQREKQAILRGDGNAVLRAQIGAWKNARKYHLSKGEWNSAFQMEKQIADAERTILSEILRRAQVRLESTVVIGSSMSASAVAVQIAQQKVAALKQATVMEEELIQAETALANAQEDYFQLVLQYAAIVRRQGIDISDPLLLAQADLRDALEQLVNAKGDLEKAEAGESVRAADLAADQAFYDSRLEDLQFLHDTDKLGKAGYIDALRALQAGVDRSTYQGEQIWRDIERTIMGLVDQVEAGFNIPTEIRMPTLFEVRRAVQADEMGLNYQDNRQQDINLYITEEVDLLAALEAIDLAFGGAINTESIRVSAGDSRITVGAF